MPTFRRCASGLTERAILSVRDQSLTDWEMFVVDDGSADGTEKLVARYSKLDSRIVSVRHEVNSGLPAQRINEVMPNARGRYFAFMFDDDAWYPDALEVLVAAMDSHPEWSMAYGDVRFPYRDASGVEHRERVLGDVPSDFDLERLETSNYIANVAVLLRRDVLTVVGTYDPHILVRRLCDWDLWLRIGRRAEVGHVDALVGEANGLLTHDSLGLTARLEYDLVRQYMDTDRTARLLPDCVLEYPIDDLSAFGSPLSGEMRHSAALMFADFYRNIGRSQDAELWEERAKRCSA